MIASEPIRSGYFHLRCNHNKFQSIKNFQIILFFFKFFSCHYNIYIVDLSKMKFSDNFEDLISKSKIFNAKTEKIDIEAIIATKKIILNN